MSVLLGYFTQGLDDVFRERYAVEPVRRPADRGRFCGVSQRLAVAQRHRLHRAKDRLEGSTEAIMADRGRKLSAVRDARKARPWKRKLTERKKEEKLAVVGETDASSAEAQLARNSRPGGDEHRTGGSERSPHLPCECGSVQEFTGDSGGSLQRCHRHLECPAFRIQKTSIPEFSDGAGR